MSNSTLDALASFSQNEEKLSQNLLGNDQSSLVEQFEPSALSVLNILNYSKALSVRKSEHLENICLILN